MAKLLPLESFGRAWRKGSVPRYPAKLALGGSAGAMDHLLFLNELQPFPDGRQISLYSDSWAVAFPGMCGDG